MNLRGEFIVPDSFINFRGSSMKNAMTIETDRYAIKFGEKSVFDLASEELYIQYAAKSLKQEKSSYLSLFLKY